MIYRFGPFVADRVGYRASKGASPLDLTPKLLDLLFYLLEHSAVLVTKEELLDKVWPGANVTDNALAQADPKGPAVRESLGQAHDNLGNLYLRLRQPPEAEAAYKEGLALREALAAEFPDVEGYRSQLVASSRSDSALSGFSSCSAMDAKCMAWVTVHNP